jgi:hypothetical protein
MRGWMKNKKLITMVVLVLVAVVIYFAMPDSHEDLISVSHFKDHIKASEVHSLDDDSNVKDNSKGDDAKQITIAVGMEKADVIGDLTLIPNRGYIIQSAQTSEGYKIVSKEGLQFIIVFNYDRVYSILLDSDSFQLPTGVGIGSSFADIKKTYPQYEIGVEPFLARYTEAGDVMFGFGWKSQYEKCKNKDDEKVEGIELFVVFGDDDLVRTIACSSEEGFSLSPPGIDVGSSFADIKKTYPQYDLVKSYTQCKKIKVDDKVTLSFIWSPDNYYEIIEDNEKVAWIEYKKIKLYKK